jgi:hypothetical protein
MDKELRLALFRKMAMSKYINNSYLPPMAAMGEDGVMRNSVDYFAVSSRKRQGRYPGSLQMLSKLRRSGQRASRALLASQLVIPAKRSASRDRIKAGAPTCYDPG